MKDLKSKLRSGKPVIGLFLASGCTAVAEIAAGCRFNLWKEGYVEPIPDGTSWKFALLKGKTVVKVSSGRNGYPNCWQMVTVQKDLSKKTVSG